MVQTLPGVDPVLPRHPIANGKLLLALTRELVDLRGRDMERQIAAVVESLQ